MDLVSIQCCSNSVSNWGIKWVIVTISLTKVFGRTVLGKRTSDQISSREWSTVIDKGVSASNNQPPSIISFQVHICTNKKYSLLKGHGMHLKNCGLKAFIITVADQLKYNYHTKQSQRKPSLTYGNQRRKLVFATVNDAHEVFMAHQNFRHFFQKEVDKLKIPQERANKRAGSLGTLPHSENKKQKRKYTHAANRMNKRKKKPETQVQVSICQGEGEIGNTSHHL